MGNTVCCCNGRGESNTSEDPLMTNAADPSEEGTATQDLHALLHAAIERLRRLLPPDLCQGIKTVTYSRVSYGASFGADQQLLDQVNESHKVHLKKDLINCQIIFVFSIINTRIEADVEAAMKQIPAGDKPVILVLMHHTTDIDFTTTKKKWKEKYERVQLDVEVLFHRTEGGLLRCEKNQKAVKEIKDFLKKK
ncbi:uncharacterized protein ACNS7B_007606 [Menidia menidia]